MAYAAYAVQPVIDDSAEIRVSYLRKVGALTMAGLALTAVTALASASLIFVFDFLASPLISGVVILGSFFAAQYGARAVVFNNDSTAVKLAGFAGGAMLEGVAFGYLVLSAALLGMTSYGNPFIFLLQATALVSLCAFGMFLYLMTGPRELSYIKGGLSVLFMPMMVLMVVSFVFPIGGPIGILLSLLFVGVSAAGLLYELNQVLHRYASTMWIEGSFSVMMGLLVLFWNILVLLMKLQRR